VSKRNKPKNQTNKKKSEKAFFDISFRESCFVDCVDCKMTNQKFYIVPNWLRRYLSQEDSLTVACANYLRTQGLVFHHTFNEGKRSRTMRAKLTGFGVLTGIPDFLIFEPVGDFSGLAIELKVKYDSGAKNRLSASQKEAQETMSRKGWNCVTVWSFEEFEEVVSQYLSQK
jgi:hypothetical protein